MTTLATRIETRTFVASSLDELEKKLAEEGLVMAKVTANTIKSYCEDAERTPIIAKRQDEVVREWVGSFAFEQEPTFGRWPKVLVAIVKTS